MERAHARLLCQLAFKARRRGLDIWVDAAYRTALRGVAKPCPRFIEDTELHHRCPGLPGQLGHVGMLWLEGSRVVCRLEAISTGAPRSRFPGPDRVPCVAVVYRAEEANALRRDGWSVVLSHNLERYLRHSPIAPPSGRPPREAQVEVVAVEPRGVETYRITFASDFIAEAARPGQFLLVECTAAAERGAFAGAKNKPWPERVGLSVDPKLPFLRRPFGFHRFRGPDYAPERLRQQPPFEPALAGIIEPGRGRNFDVLFKVVGRGTQRLAQMRRGERLSARGPLGKPIEIRPDLDTALLIAGGIGAGPLFALAQELRGQGRRVEAILGAVDRASAPLGPQDFEEIGARAALVTEKEDGLLVTDYVGRHLAETTAGVTEIFACGPSGMLREVARIVPPGIAVQVLMEQRMACGMGVCRGCVVRLRSAGREPFYHTVCRDGPAFRAEEVAWEEIASTAG